ncbi:TetR family transcriptional regulator [bacterium]|nr:TetR family transcriptional regulator [bacterium]
MNVHSQPGNPTPMQLAVQSQFPSPADIRSAEILASVRQAFVDKGFDGASMQDLARAAGMSVGNFYRYFASKSAIIQALILQDAAQIRRDFAAILDTPDPIATLARAIHDRIQSSACAKDAELWAEIEAASRRSPEIAEASRQLEAEVVHQILAVFASATGLTPDEAQGRFSGHASFILVMVKSASCISSAAPLDQEQVRTRIGRSIDQTLAEVSASGTRPDCPAPVSRPQPATI